MVVPLFTVKTKPWRAGSPASRVPLRFVSLYFVTRIAPLAGGGGGQLTVTVAGLVVVALPSLPDATLALLLNVPQLRAVAVKVTEAVWPGARLQVPKLRLVSPALGLVVEVRVPVPPAAPVVA